MSREININRQLLGLEDILFGTGTVEQTRGGQLVTVTKVNAGNLPFDETRTLIQWAQSVNLEQLGNIITELQAIYDNLASISNVEDNLSLLNNIISNITVLQELHTNLSILQNVNSNITIITEVNTNLDILTSIYNNLSALVNIHTNLTSLLAIDTNMQQLLAIDTNLPDLLSINTNIVPNITEILDVNNKAEQVALDKQVVESLASQVTMDKQDINTMKLAVETIYDTFDDRFLGAKDIDPLVDNDGNALLDGALYFNTLSNALKVYVLDITTWVTIPQIYLSSLLDVQLTSITTNSILTWNGAKWVNTTTPVFDSIKLTGTNYGVMSWNTDEQVPSITLNSDVDIDLGESLILVKNSTGSTILDGRVVMVVGSNGNSGNILVSLHSGLKADAKRTIGIATQNILNHNMGFVTKEGKVKGINTTGSIYGETWVDGDILYVKANGVLTRVEPLDSQLKMPIAFVIHAHTNGTLYVRTTGIDENHDRDLISTKLDTSEYTATDILTKLKTVDGSGSGLEAETATKLATARTINGVSFDGTANIVAPTNLTVGTRTTTAVPIESSSGTSASIPAASTTLAGVMTSADKVKLDGIAANANNYVLPARLSSSALAITDWNLAVENGWYMGDNALNGPIANWCLGTVEVHNPLWVTQTVHLFTTDSSADSRVWRRQQNNDTWGNWYRLQLTQEEQDARYVQTTGDQTIAGVKTFSSSPIVPTPTAETQAVNKTYADLKVALTDFTGANQSKSANGYQKLPGDLIIQWGQNGAVQSVTFPIAFPNACLTVVATMYGSSSAQQINEQSTVSYTTTDFKYTSFVWSKRWFAIGY